MRALYAVFVALAMAPLAGPALAAPSTYRVTPQAAPNDGQVVVHDVAWRCSGGSCVAPRTGKSTDATVCSAVARNFGPIASFAAGGDDFDAAAIDKCNRRAR